MRKIQLFNILGKASICVALAFICLGAAGQEMIDMSKISVLCDQINTYKLKKVLPDGYVYDTSGDGGEIVLTRDKDNPNRYTSRYPQSPYMTGCDYEVKRLGKTVALFGYLGHYQGDHPYVLLFAADSHETYCEQWQERMKGGIEHCEWLFSVPIDDNFFMEIDIDQLQRMLSMLEQSKQHDALVSFNITKLNQLIEQYYEMEEADDCEADHP